MTTTIDARSSWPVIVIAAVLVVLFVPFSSTVMGVRYTYTLRTVAIGGAFLGAVSGAIGSFAVLRKESLLGDALSHAALPGVAVAFLVAGRELGALLVGAGLTSLLGVAAIRVMTGYTRIKEDAAMGIVLTGWFAAGIMGLTYIQGRPDASQAGLDSFIFGQAASIVRSDVFLLAAVSTVAIVLLITFWKQFKLITFNAEFAGANGFNVTLWSALLSTLVVVAIVMGLQLAGVVLMVGMLIAPGVAARQWTTKLEAMVPLAAIIGAAAGGIGAVLSAVDRNLPTGPMIIVTASAIVAISILFAPQRGVVWVVLTRWRDARRFAMRTVLRDVYHYVHDHSASVAGVPDSFIAGVRGRPGRRALNRLLARRMLRKTIDADTGTRWNLTETGQRVASEDARNQSLWDMYREAGLRLDLPVIAEQRDRDIRALLSPEAIDALTDLLGDKEGEPRVRY